MEFEIFLKTTKEVQDFCYICSKNKDDIEVHSGKYIVDGKSLMGLFSLDLTGPVHVIVENPNDEFMDEVKSFCKRLKD